MRFPHDVVIPNSIPDTFKVYLGNVETCGRVTTDELLLIIKIK